MGEGTHVIGCGGVGQVIVDDPSRARVVAGGVGGSLLLLPSYLARPSRIAVVVSAQPNLPGMRTQRFP